MAGSAEDKNDEREEHDRFIIDKLCRINAREAHGGKPACEYEYSSNDRGDPGKKSDGYADSRHEKYPGENGGGNRRDGRGRCKPRIETTHGTTLEREGEWVIKKCGPSKIEKTEADRYT